MNIAWPWPESSTDKTHSLLLVIVLPDYSMLIRDRPLGLGRKCPCIWMFSLLATDPFLLPKESYAPGLELLHDSSLWGNPPNTNMACLSSLSVTFGLRLQPTHRWLPEMLMQKNRWQAAMPLWKNPIGGILRVRWSRRWECQNNSEYRP